MGKHSLGTYTAFAIMSDPPTHNFWYRLTNIHCFFLVPCHSPIFEYPWFDSVRCAKVYEVRIWLEYDGRTCMVIWEVWISGMIECKVCEVFKVWWYYRWEYERFKSVRGVITWEVWWYEGYESMRGMSRPRVWKVLEYDRAPLRYPMSDNFWRNDIS